MADDNILRSYRSNEPARRASAPAGARDTGGSDPLAELARLIGQSDPFADLERDSGQAAEARQRAAQQRMMQSQDIYFAELAGKKWPPEP